jgi:hypothetical protein
MQEGRTEIFEKLARDGFVIFAGTGVTSATGIPSWVSLLRELQRKLGEQVYNDEITEDESDVFPVIAQKLYDKFVEIEGDEGKGKQAYLKAVRECLETSDWDYGPAQLSIINVCKKIITTNFDSTFDDAISDYYRFRGEKRGNFDVQALPKLKYMELFKRDHSLIYVHGRTAENIVFKKEDYERYYSIDPGKSKSSRTLRDFYKFLYQDHHIIFIGFSFKDVFVKKLLQNIYKEVVADEKANRQFSSSEHSRLDDVDHYAFMHDEYCAKITELRRKYPEGSQEYKREKNRLESYREKFRILCSELADIKITVLKYKNHKEYRSWLNTIDDEIIKSQEHKKVDSPMSTWSPEDG